MKYSRIVAVPVIAVLIAACSGAASPSPSSAPSTAASAPASASSGASATPAASMAAKDIVIPKPSGDLTVKIGQPSTTSISTVPLQMTVDRLNSQGWNTQLVAFTATNLNTQALAQAQVQFSEAQVLDAARAIQKGGQISWVGENNRGEFVIAATNAITDCKQLDGKRLGLAGQAYPVSVVTLGYLKDSCSATPQVLITPDGADRAVAMENGQLDATILQFGDWVELDHRSPGKFHLLDTGGALNITGAELWVNKSWADQHPDLAAAFLAEIFRTFEMIQEDPSVLKAAVEKDLPGTSPDTLDSLIQQYIDTVKAWPGNGGDTSPVAATLDYFTKAGELQPGLDANALVDQAVRTKALQLVNESQ